MLLRAIQTEMLLGVVATGVISPAWQMCLSAGMYAGNDEAISMLHLIAQALESSPAGAWLPSLSGRYPAA